MGEIQAYEQAINVQTHLIVDCYAQAIGSMWAMALNPNLKGEASHEK